MKIEFIEKQVKATLNHEGLTVSNTGEQITRKYLEGKISSDEAIKNIIKYHLSKGGVYNV